VQEAKNSYRQRNAEKKQRYDGNAQH
jgi:hypothetical protein